eukprot:scaffold11704_cov72-Phaeocystis_antarctica.AAC.8
MRRSSCCTRQRRTAGDLAHSPGPEAPDEKNPVRRLRRAHVLRPAKDNVHEALLRRQSDDESESELH